jgi:undecaprenyl-diphosphatase
MTMVYAALLGIIQGLTEFLPVSSSAHLILARAFFGWNSDQFGVAFDVACHVGTLVAVVIYFWPQVAAMLKAVPRLIDLPRGSRDPSAWLIVLLAVATIPAVVVGLLFGHALEEGLRTPEVAVITLAVVALAFFVVERTGAKRRDQGSLGVTDAFLIGCAQAAALVPGVSRSGSTIATAMALGMRRDEAARFVFLVGIPAILGAAAKEGAHFVRHGLPPGEGPLFAIGMVSSAVVGYFAVAFFIRYLSGHSLAVFAWYRLALAASVVVWWVAR